MQELITDGLKVKLKTSQKFVADWYETNKRDFNNELCELIEYAVDAAYYTEYTNADYKVGQMFKFITKEKDSIITLVNMHQFGYEIEQEPKYIVELPNPNRRNLEAGTFLAKKDGKLVIHSTSKEQVNKSTSYILTESEIKEDFDWAWQFAKKVED